MILFSPPKHAALASAHLSEVTPELNKDVAKQQDGSKNRISAGIPVSARRRICPWTQNLKKEKERSGFLGAFGCLGKEPSTIDKPNEQVHQTLDRKVWKEDLETLCPLNAALNALTQQGTPLNI